MKKEQTTNFFSVILGYILMKSTGLKTPYVKKIQKQKREELKKQYQQQLDAHHAEYRGWTTEHRENPPYDAAREARLAQEIKRTQELYLHGNRQNN